MVFNFDIPENEEVTKEIVIDDTIIDDSEDIQDTLEMCDAFCVQFNNLILIQSHVKKFGFNKQMLHLLNTDNNLFKMLDLDIPENFDEQVDEVIVKLNMEMDFTFHDAAKKIADKFIEIFNAIINKFKEVYRTYMLGAKKLQKMIATIRKDKYGSNGQFIDEAETLKKEVKACTLSTWQDNIRKMREGYKSLLNISFDKRLGFKVDSDNKVKEALLALNYELVFNTNTGFIDIKKKDGVILESKDLGTLGWEVGKVNNELVKSGQIISAIEKLNGFISVLEKWKKEAVKDDKIFVSKAIIINQVKTSVHICSIMMDGYKSHLQVLLSIADKAIMKKES